VLLCFIALQLYFVIRVAMMVVVDPQSTPFPALGGLAAF